MNRPAIFLDRDGTIIAQKADIIQVRDLRVLPRVPEALAKLSKLGFVLVVVTNQPVIGKGLITKKGVGRLNEALNQSLAKRGAEIDAFYVCPHRYQDHCGCRKPKTLLIKKAIKRFSIDTRRSFFIGDDVRDIETGRRIRVKTVLVRTGNGRKKSEFFHTKPDMTAKDLFSAATKIKKLIKK